ncbi:S-layer homology domain-containing protein [Butyricicoccus sp. AM05-1]|uniref:S-layer homology domain-containing protein n=1 Tax=Butyricicoccus sp. AM05-1 TaxID=2292004 RepID=UPI0013140716|nr:S-layer homology domain-containing protein [Butyricicoccus sp. AM05-1]
MKFHPRFSGNRDSGENLKKVLALVLAFACAFTMFAGAAFTDQADIKATDAVDTLVALGVVEGFEDGSFQPNATVTRAQMAKMIYVLRTGKSDASAYNDDKTSFTDIGSHWARGYIKYCQSLGIIAGKSNTIFAPNANVTAQEAAKMLLVTLGYNAEKAGLTGAGWAAKTNALADENGLLDDVNTSFTSACPRQYAAQLIYNAINAATVVWRDDAYTNMALTGTDYLPTVGEKYMGLIRTSVTVYGDKARNDSLKDGELEVVLNKKTSEAGDADEHKIVTYSVSDITSKIGQSVELLWKESKDTKNNLDKNDKIYGMYNTRDTSVVEATVADIDDDFTDANKVKINGTKYEFASGAELYTNLDSGVTADKASVEALIKTAPKKTGDKIRVLLNDSNKITAVYLTTSDLYKVTAVSGKKVSIAGIGTVDTSENNSTVYDGVKKDDVVVVTKLYKSAVADATFVIEKAVSVTGKLTGYTGTKSVKVDGTSYPQYAKAAFKTNLTDDSVSALQSGDVDDEVTVYLVNGYARAIQKNSDDMNQYAVVTDVNDGKLDSNFSEPKAELLFADGSKKTVVLHKDSVLYADANSNHNGAAKLATGVDISTALAKGELVKYAERSNGQYKIEEIAHADSHYQTYTGDFYKKDTKALMGTVTAGDCPLFYTNASGEYKVSNVRSLNDITLSSKQVDYIVKDGKVVAAFANMTARPNGAAGDTKYGIITTDGTTTTKDGDPYTMYTIWTGEETVVYVDGDQNGLAKGKLVSFDPSADQTYTQDSNGTKDFTILDGSAIGKGVKIAVTDYSESDKTITFANGLKVEGNAYVEISKTTKALDDDAQIVYIDADNNKAGDSGVGITEFDGTTGYANALIVYDGNNASNKIVAVIVNTNSDVDVMGQKNVAATKYSVAAPSVTGTTTGITATADKTTALEGETVTVTVKLDATATATKVTVSGTNATVTPAGATTVAAGNTYTFTVVVGASAPAITVTAA